MKSTALSRFLLCGCLLLAFCAGCAGTRARTLPDPTEISATAGNYPAPNNGAVVLASAEEFASPGDDNTSGSFAAETEQEPGTMSEPAVGPEPLQPGPYEAVEYGLYRIQPGDQLAIKFRSSSTRDLNDEVIVRPDGQIALQLIGDITAAYRTSEELRGLLTEAYSAYLRDPQITVIVKRFAGNQVFVGGEVQKPGSIRLAGGMTTLQAIIESGGFRDTADRHRVVVRRLGGGSQEFDLHAELHGKAFGQDIILQPYDVVYVPKSRIAKVNQFVDQYINRMFPLDRSFGVFLSYSGFSPAQTLP